MNQEKASDTRPGLFSCALLVILLYVRQGDVYPLYRHSSLPGILLCKKDPGHARMPGLWMDSGPSSSFVGMTAKRGYCVCRMSYFVSIIWYSYILNTAYEILSTTCQLLSTQVFFLAPKTKGLVPRVQSLWSWFYSVLTGDSTRSRSVRFFAYCSLDARMTFCRFWLFEDARESVWAGNGRDIVPSIISFTITW